jgi:hypothetical protein
MSPFRDDDNLNIAILIGSKRGCQAMVLRGFHFFMGFSMGRSALPLTILMVLLSLRCASGDELKADLPNLLQAPSPIEKMVGETLSYDISFLWFDRLAEGKLSFSRGESPNTYRAVLEARTLGVAAWLTRDRVQRYVSEMEVGPGGKLRSLFHESHIVKGSGNDIKDRTSLYEFDYGNRRIRYQRARNGTFYKEVLLPMDEGDPPNDFLTAFFNFWAGYLGTKKEGHRFVIPAFDREGTEEIVVDILFPRERPKDKFFPREGLLCRVSMDKEVFDTGGGMVYVWFDKYDRPARGIVENVIGLGHVRGRLR